MVDNAWNIHNRTVISSVQDQSSVYYIHPSDSASLQLASVKFNGTGFTSWKRSMILSLSHKNKIGFVDGSIPKPDATSPDFKPWERCNNLVCSWLLFNLDEEIAQSCLYFDYASEIWSDLEDRFGFSTLSQVYSVEQKLADLSQGSKSVSSFFTEIRTLWDALADASPPVRCICTKCTCNVNHRLLQKQQEHRLVQFMMKLSDKFSTIRGNVLMQQQQQLPTVSQAFRIFSQEERHQEVSQIVSNTESLAFVADNKKHTDAAISGSKPSAANLPGKRNTKYYCTHCKINGHSIERCFKINGYPPGFKGFKDKKLAAMATTSDDSPPITNAQYSQLMSLLNNQSSNCQTNDKNDHLAMLAGKYCFLSEHCGKTGWLIDSGATDHICSNLSAFVHYTKVNPTEYITIPDGKQVAVKHTGSIQLTADLTLHNVLHVPDFHFNLISVQKLCQDLKCEVFFTVDKCILQGLSQRNCQMPLGERQGGLYSINSVQTADKKLCFAATTDAKVWHLRLGHIPFSSLKLLFPQVVLPLWMLFVKYVQKLNRQN
nr:PREDICTED: uncharacterized protein LOC108226191 [Daucus carota subsp. sativus]